MSKADICVIYNPAAGRGHAANTFKRLRRLLGSRAEFRPTERPEHATELAHQAVLDGFPVITAAGGDGTVHEVGNGILQAGDHDAVFAVAPAGSANDYAFSLGLAHDWWCEPNPEIGPRLVDVGVIRAADRERYFLNGMGVGFNGAVTIEARKIPRLRGVPLYATAVIRAMNKSFHAPTLSVSLDDNEQHLEVLALTLGMGQREGKFLLTPDAVLDDGLLDYLVVGPITRRKLVQYIPRMISGKFPANDPALTRGRCRSAILSGDHSLIVHTDGELFCIPKDKVTRVEVELLPGRLKVLGSFPISEPHQ